MLRIMMKSKIHNATVTQTNVNYRGSITIDSVLLKDADIFEGEKVQVVNVSNGSRIETYAIKGEANAGAICMNGGAALHAKVGDNVLIISYCLADSKEAVAIKENVIIVDKENKKVKK